MADALMSLLLEQLGSVIVQEVKKEVSLVAGAKQDIQNLLSTFTSIRAVINDAERKQITVEAIKVWLQNLKNIAYDMEDLLDEWNTHILRSQIRATFHQKNLMGIFRPLVAHHTIGHGTKEIRERLDIIARDRHDYHFNESIRVDEPQRELTSSVVDLSEICGRDLDKKAIMSRLLSESSREQEGKVVPIIISIVGMGGLGKTTLAQCAFNDPCVVNSGQFERIIWVCVSDPFDKVRLAKAIIQGMGEKVPESNEWDALHRRLTHVLKDKRYLLVLDDMWTNNHAEWEPFRISLQGGAQSSRILVTTRNVGVATMMSATYTRHLEELPWEDCWSLFSRIAFAGRAVEEQRMLEGIGMEIVGKCKGVPLFVKTLASAMRFKRSKEDWLEVLDNDIWDVHEVANQALPALMLSYYALPPVLRRCFTFCAIFPKAHDISKDELIKLWMAQGFLNSISSGGRSREPESTGNDYFHNLVMRSVFQNITRDSDGNITTCKMHDLVHDCAQFVANNETFLMETQSDITRFERGFNARHLTILFDKPDTNVAGSNFNLSSIFKAKKLRTLKLALRPKLDKESIAATRVLHFKHLAHVWALDLSKTSLTELPGEIAELIHLRYLDLSYTKLKELPQSLSKLCNLQTFRLKGCCYLRVLPNRMGEMIKLRHFENEGTRLHYMPQGIKHMRSLRTLNEFVVESEKNRAACRLRELKDLKLYGSLKISSISKLDNHIYEEAKEANLKEKEHLYDVHLGFGCHANDQKGVGMDDVLEGLQVHPNVKELCISSYKGSQLPTWMMRDTMMMFYQLRRLRLIECFECSELPSLGSLPCLEDVHIEKMKVKNINNKFCIAVEMSSSSSFLKLKRLVIKQMEELEELDIKLEDGDHMPQLSELRIVNCPMLRTLPALGKLKSLETLEFKSLESIKQLNLEFLGISKVLDDSSSSSSSREPAAKVAIFPKLRFLKFHEMPALEDWSLPLMRSDLDIMPCVRELSLISCRKLRELPALGRLQLLEELKIEGMDSIERIGNEFWGIDHAARRSSAIRSSAHDDIGTTDHGGDQVAVPVIHAFPELKRLSFQNMNKWEVWDAQLRPTGENEQQQHIEHIGGGGRRRYGNTRITIIMPRLNFLALQNCRNLKSIRFKISSPGVLRQEVNAQCFLVHVPLTRGGVHVREKEGV